jgi:quercetin dioxygenase-like cupin family protein
VKLARIPWSEATAPDPAALEAQLVREGFEVFSWSDSPGRHYVPHRHLHDESLCGVRGEIVFEIEGETYVLGPGDRLMLPRGTVHAATAGRAGATYLIGQRH